METYLIGVDTSKHNFQVCGVTREGRKTFERKVNRSQVIGFLRSYPGATVALEVGSGAHFFGRTLKALGHEVRLIPAFFVKPFLKSQKNDRNDAEAIAEAALRPGMRFVPVKAEAQQDIQNLHRVRERLIGNRTAVVNQIRGLLAEYGVVIPQGITKLRSALPELLPRLEEQLSTLTVNVLLGLQEELRSYDDRIKDFDKRLTLLSDAHPVAHRLKEIPGIGVLSSTAAVAATTAPHEFKNGRQYAAWVGLTPRQYSTGGKTRLGAISKRGNPYLRKLLIHGARAVVRTVHGKDDPRSAWIRHLLERRGFHKTCVAVANKNARILWHLLTKPEEHYRQGALLKEGSHAAA